MCISAAGSYATHVYQRSSIIRYACVCCLAWYVLRLVAQQPHTLRMRTLPTLIRYACGLVAQLQLEQDLAVYEALSY